MVLKKWEGIKNLVYVLIMSFGWNGINNICFRVDILRLSQICGLEEYIVISG